MFYIKEGLKDQPVKSLKYLVVHLPSRLVVERVPMPVLLKSEQEHYNASLHE